MMKQREFFFVLVILMTFGCYWKTTNIYQVQVDGGVTAAPWSIGGQNCAPGGTAPRLDGGTGGIIGTEVPVASAERDSSAPADGVGAALTGSETPPLPSGSVDLSSALGSDAAGSETGRAGA